MTKKQIKNKIAKLIKQTKQLEIKQDTLNVKADRFENYESATDDALTVLRRAIKEQFVKQYDPEVETYLEDKILEYRDKYSEAEEKSIEIKEKIEDIECEIDELKDQLRGAKNEK